MTRALCWVLLAVFSFSTAALAQDDDDLAPIAPKKPKPAAAKPKPAPKPKPPPATKPTAVKPPVDDDDLAPIAALKGDVVVKLPQGLANAVLNVDGKDVGPVSAAPQSLSPGEHTIKVRRPGYTEFSKKVTVAAGKSVEVEARLTASAAVLSVKSDVPDAQVYLNGKLAGVVPLEDLEVPPGAVELSVRKPGFKEDKQKLTLVAGRDYPVAVKLTPGTTSTIVAASDRPADTRLTPSDENPDLTSPAVSTTAEETPLVGRWYFWAGVAAVAVGAAVVTGVVMNQNQPPRRQTEGEVCSGAGGTCDLCVGLVCSRSGLGAGVLTF